MISKLWVFWLESWLQGFVVKMGTASIIQWCYFLSEKNIYPGVNAQILNVACGLWCESNIMAVRAFAVANNLQGKDFALQRVWVANAIFAPCFC